MYFAELHREYGDNPRAVATELVRDAHPGPHHVRVVLEHVVLWELELFAHTLCRKQGATQVVVQDVQQLGNGGFPGPGFVDLTEDHGFGV